MKRILAILIAACLVVVFAPQDVLAQDGCGVLPCRADFNKDGCVTIEDFFYLVEPEFHPFIWELLDVDDNGTLEPADGQAFNCLVDEGACWILGDYDHNGVVSASDLSTFLAAWGTFNPCVDLTGDGMVGIWDYVTFLQQFGVGG